MINKPIVELDFFEAKNQLRQYLKTQTKFKDYNFEGANMSVLLDLLAYNTYQNNFYTNMAISEMFLDSAQQPDSIISHAKELNYLPRSAKSAVAIIDITIKNTTTTDNSIFIPRNTKFSTSYNGTNFIFYTKKAHIATKKSANIFQVGCVEIFEGVNVSEGYIFSVNKKNYTINNENIDLSSIRLIDIQAEEEYYHQKDLFGVKPTDRVFYVEPSFNSKYAIVFGNNFFGKTPIEEAKLVVEYQISSGSVPNGARKFTTNDIPNTIVTTTSPAVGGAEKESIESIKFFAPKSIQVQERAVTASDYAVLLKQKFPEIQAISVMGGELLSPPQFGKVAISVKLFDKSTVSETVISTYKRYISDKTTLSVIPIFIQPKFNYIKMELSINYDRNLSTMTENELEFLAREEIKSFNNKYLNDFNKIFSTSKLISRLNELDASIFGVNIIAKPIIEYYPVPGYKANPTFDFSMNLIRPYPYRSNTGLINFKPSLESSVFLKSNQQVKIMDNGAGNVMLVNPDISKNQIYELRVGNIDYDTGKVNLIDFVVQGYPGRGVLFYSDTIDKDINTSPNSILSIRDTDVTIKFKSI